MMTIVPASRPYTVHFSARSMRTISPAKYPQKPTEIALQKLQAKKFEKGNDITWWPLEDALNKIEQATVKNDINGKNTLNDRDKFKNTFLHYVIDPNRYKFEYDKLGTTREAKYKALVSQLLNKKPDVNLKDKNGDRPLSVAIDFAYAATKQDYKKLYQAIQEVVISLLKQGAFVKKADLKALPKSEKGTKELREQVKASYEAQRNSFFAKIVALFK